MPSEEFYKKALLAAGTIAIAIDSVRRSTPLTLSMNLEKLFHVYDDYNKIIFDQVLEDNKK